MRLKLNVDSTMNLLRARSTLIASVCLLAGSPALSQTVRVLADSGWVSQRIVMLKGMGEVHSPSDSTRLATAVGINLVASISRREGRRLWIMSTSGGDSGWVDSVDVLRLAGAIPYFTRLIERQPDNWDAYLRRAEAEHALNQRDAATADYSKAIELMKQARAWPGAAPSYRQEWQRQLEEYERALAARGAKGPL